MKDWIEGNEKLEIPITDKTDKEKSTKEYVDLYNFVKNNSKK